MFAPFVVHSSTLFIDQRSMWLGERSSCAKLVSVYIGLDADKSGFYVVLRRHTFLGLWCAVRMQEETALPLFFFVDVASYL